MLCRVVQVNTNISEYTLIFVLYSQQKEMDAYANVAYSVEYFKMYTSYVPLGRYSLVMRCRGIESIKNTVQFLNKWHIFKSISKLDEFHPRPYNNVCKYALELFHLISYCKCKKKQLYFTGNFVRRIFFDFLVPPEY